MSIEHQHPIFPKLVLVVSVLILILLLFGCTQKTSYIPIKVDANLSDANVVRYVGGIDLPVLDSGKFLTNDGSVLSWATVTSGSGLDTNWQTSWSLFDANIKSQYGTYFVKQVDGNAWYEKKLDLNADINALINPRGYLTSAIDTNCAVYGSCSQVVYYDNDTGANNNVDLLTNVGDISAFNVVGSYFWGQGNINTWSHGFWYDVFGNYWNFDDVIHAPNFIQNNNQVCDSSNNCNYFSGTPIDTNWQTSWSTFDANMKAQYRKYSVDLNTSANINADGNMGAININAKSLVLAYDSNNFLSTVTSSTGATTFGITSSSVAGGFIFNAGTPIGNGLVGSSITLNSSLASDRTTTGTASAGGAISLSAGNGGSSTIAGSANTAGQGGNITLLAGTGGNVANATSTTASNNGGTIQLTAGAGGTLSANGGFIGSTPNGGTLLLQSGNAGTVLAGYSGTILGSPTGGQVLVQTGSGSSGIAPVLNGGAGGILNFLLGVGGTAGLSKIGGIGGSLSFQGGQGGSATQSGAGTNTGGGGGSLTYIGGSGGTASNGGTSSIGGEGGAITFTGGNGNIGTTTGGAGASIKFTAGNAGAGGNANGGNMYFLTGSATGSGTIGNILLGVGSTGTIRGNVGIRTSTPQNALNVIGDINATQPIKTDANFWVGGLQGITKNMSITQGAGTCDLNFVGGILIASTC